MGDPSWYAPGPFGRPGLALQHTSHWCGTRPLNTSPPACPLPAGTRRIPADGPTPAQRPSYAAEVRLPNRRRPRGRSATSNSTASPIALAKSCPAPRSRATDWTRRRSRACGRWSLATPVCSPAPRPLVDGAQRRSASSAGGDRLPSSGYRTGTRGGGLPGRPRVGTVTDTSSGVRRALSSAGPDRRARPRTPPIVSIWRIVALPLAFVVYVLVVAWRGRNARRRCRGIPGGGGPQDPSTVEASLTLERSTRRLLQQGLSNEGFDWLRPRYAGRPVRPADERRGLAIGNSRGEPHQRGT